MLRPRHNIAVRLDQVASASGATVSTGRRCATLSEMPSRSTNNDMEGLERDSDDLRPDPSGGELMRALPIAEGPKIAFLPGHK